MDVPNLQQAFDQAVAGSKELSERPDNETLLRLYSLYKQATEGDCQLDPPSNPFDIVNKAKYESWHRLTGMSKEAAMESYVQLVNELKK